MGRVVETLGLVESGGGAQDRDASVFAGCSFRHDRRQYSPDPCLFHRLVLVSRPGRPFLARPPSIHRPCGHATTVPNHAAGVRAKEICVPSRRPWSLPAPRAAFRPSASPATDWTVVLSYLP